MVSFSNFQRLDPAARDVANGLLASAEEQPYPFIAFIYRWMAFNGWMSAVTLEDTDREMIDAIASAPRLIEAFGQLLAHDPNFQRIIGEFTALWPVLNVRSVRVKLGYDAFRQHGRDALLAREDAEKVKRQPADWVAGGIPSWEQVLRTVYQVRCNLFHGEKSPQSARDYELVVASDRILARFIAGTGCFGWHDR